MPYRCFMTLVCAVILASLASFLPGPGEKGDGIQSLITKAKKAQQRKQPEQAALFLRQALQQAGRLPDSGDRKKQVKHIAGLLRKADPLASKWMQAEAKVAKAYIGLAKQYQKKGWLRAARSILEDATPAAPRPAAKPLQSVQSALEKEASASKTSFISQFKGGETVGDQHGLDRGGHRGAQPGA